MQHEKLSAQWLALHTEEAAVMYELIAAAIRGKTKKQERLLEAVRAITHAKANLMQGMQSLVENDED